MMNQQKFLKQLQTLRGIDQLLQVIARLRHPTEGCPWDLKQTHQSLKRYMLEEAYEAVEAMDALPPDSDSPEPLPDPLKEELGDVLLQVALHSQLAEEAGRFNFQDVCEAIAEKLIRRHPHVFGEIPNGAVDDPEAVARQWELIKKREKNLDVESDAETPESVLTGISQARPALSRALETSQRAVKVGFQWPDLNALWDCVMSEYDEFRSEADATHTEGTVSAEQFARLEEEMGDILFASVNLARHFKIDPEVALTRATAKFTRRFQAMEMLLMKQVRQSAPDGALPEGFTLADKMETLDFATWDSLWNKAKQVVAASS